jgi:hypothetical protein
MVLGSNPEASQISHFHKKLKFQQQQKQQLPMTSLARVSGSVSQDSGQPSCSQPAQSTNQPANRPIRRTELRQSERQVGATTVPTANYATRSAQQPTLQLGQLSGQSTTRSSGQPSCNWRSRTAELQLASPDSRVAVGARVGRSSRQRARPAPTS